MNSELPTINLRPYATIALWFFLPSAVTVLMLRLYYMVRSKGTPPASVYQRHYRRTLALIIGLYLLADVSSTLSTYTPTFYTLMNVSPTSMTIKTLRKSFKTLSLQFHPDKNPLEQDLFMQVRNAYEILSNPRKKLIYDRFGEQTISCSYCKTMRDYMTQGAAMSIAFYGGTLGMMSLIGRLTARGGSGGYFWKYWVVLVMFTIEIFLLTRTQLSPSLTSLLTDEPTFRWIEILHRTGIVGVIALAQLSPLLFPTDDRTEKQLLEQLEDAICNLKIRKDAVGGSRVAYEAK